MSSTLPENLAVGSAGHIGDHNEIHEFINDQPAVRTVRTGPLIQGAYVGTSVNNVAIDNLATREYQYGRGVQLVSDYSDGTSQTTFRGTAAQLDPWQTWKNARRGRRLLFSFALYGADTWTFADIITGTYDADFTALATNLISRDLGDSILTWCWQANGSNWHYWGTLAHASPSQFTLAYAHVKTIMMAVAGAKFEWCASFRRGTGGGASSPFSMVPLGEVDYVAVDTYDHSFTATPFTYPLFPAWAAVTTYSFGAKVTRGAKWYQALGTSLNAPPESSPAQWGTYAGTALEQLDWKNRQIYVTDVELFGGTYGIDEWREYCLFNNVTMAINEFALSGRNDGSSAGHGGLSNAYFFQRVHDFAADPTNNVAYYVYVDTTESDGDHRLYTLPDGTTSDFSTEVVELAHDLLGRDGDKFGIAQSGLTLPPRVVLSANPTMGSAPLTTVLTANVTVGSDPLADYPYQFIPGGAVSELVPTIQASNTRSISYTASGLYTAAATVVDEEGRQGVDDVDILVPVRTFYTWDGGLSGTQPVSMSWGSATSTSSDPATITADNTTVFSGAGSMKIANSNPMPASGTDWLRASSGSVSPDYSSGTTLGVMVYLPVGVAGTWAARLMAQDAGSSWVTGPSFNLVAGQWTLVLWKSTDAPPFPQTPSRPIAVEVGGTDVNGSGHVFVDSLVWG